MGNLFDSLRKLDEADVILKIDVRTPDPFERIPVDMAERMMNSPRHCLLCEAGIPRKPVIVRTVPQRELP